MASPSLGPFIPAMELWGFPKQPGPPSLVSGFDVPHPAHTPIFLPAQPGKAHMDTIPKPTPPPNPIIFLLPEPQQLSPNHPKPKALNNQCKVPLSVSSLPKNPAATSPWPWCFPTPQGWDHLVLGAPMGAKTESWCIRQLPHAKSYPYGPTMS